MKIPCTDDGIRPAGPQDRCFYCSSPKGQPHGPNCVLLKKAVVIELSVKMIVDVPQSWDAHNIDFFFNDSGHCLGTEVRQLAEENDRTLGQCFTCNRAEVVFVREATPEDVREYTNNPELVVEAARLLLNLPRSPQ